MISAIDKIFIAMLFKNAAKEVRDYFLWASTAQSAFDSIALGDENRPFYDNHMVLLFNDTVKDVKFNMMLQQLSSVEGFVKSYDIRIDKYPYKCVCFERSFFQASDFDKIIEADFKEIDNKLKVEVLKFWNAPALSSVGKILNSDSDIDTDVFERMVVPKETYHSELRRR